MRFLRFVYLTFSLFGLFPLQALDFHIGASARLLSEGTAPYPLMTLTALQNDAFFKNKFFKDPQTGKFPSISTYTTRSNMPEWGVVIGIAQSLALFSLGIDAYGYLKSEEFKGYIGQNGYIYNINANKSVSVGLLGKAGFNIGPLTLGPQVGIEAAIWSVKSSDKTPAAPAITATLYQKSLNLGIFGAFGFGPLYLEASGGALASSEKGRLFGSATIGLQL